MTGTTTAPGILPLAVQDCFDYVSSGHKDELREYLLRISYLEIYNEQIIDLLSENTTPTAVRIFESPREGVVVRGLREEVVTSPHDVHHWIAQGERRRQVGSTNMNKHSSRSHAIFRLWIESKSLSDGGVRVSSLSLVDLAGSESVRLTGSTGDRQKEGQYINKSLTTLGQVVFKLSELQRRQDNDTTKAHHIPYRDSKLTRLLQPSLSGNAQIVLISCISPQVSHLQESHNTLKFAVRAKRIQQHATVSEVADEKTMYVCV
jgi:centromeric protein E